MVCGFLMSSGFMVLRCLAMMFGQLARDDAPPSHDAREFLALFSP
jgi:hypothetical protein